MRPWRPARRKRDAISTPLLAISTTGTPTGVQTGPDTPETGLGASTVDGSLFVSVYAIDPAQDREAPVAALPVLIGCQAVCPEALRDDPAVRAFCDWLHAEVSAVQQRLRETAAADR